MSQNGVFSYIFGVLGQNFCLSCPYIPPPAPMMAIRALRWAVPRFEVFRWGLTLLRGGWRRSSTQVVSANFFEHVALQRRSDVFVTFCQICLGYSCRLYPLRCVGVWAVAVGVPGTS